MKHTDLARKCFDIGEKKISRDIIEALLTIKRAAAQSNFDLGAISKEKRDVILNTIDDLRENYREERYDLSIYQTGSGTNTNMNVNEVVSYFASEKGDLSIHPNDDVNKSQSSNDVFPSAIHIASYKNYLELEPEIEKMIEELDRHVKKSEGITKIGRTHLQDAVLMPLCDQFRSYRDILKANLSAIRTHADKLLKLPLGGTAIGTGLNAPDGFDKKIARYLSEETNCEFKPVDNKFSLIGSKSELSRFHKSLVSLAEELIKLSNDIRFMACGPRGGIGELILPKNLDGSSIMPGKVNPVQCESMIMVCFRVMGNDTTVSLGASSGMLELNVAMPVMAECIIESEKLLRDSLKSFRINLLEGLEYNTNKIKKNVENSLMKITPISKIIGYENTSKIVDFAIEKDIDILEAIRLTDFIDYEKAKELIDKGV